MLQWAFQIMVALGAADTIVRGLSPGDSAALPEVQTHYGHSTIKLHITAERVDHIPAHETPGVAEAHALAANLPEHFAPNM